MSSFSFVFFFSLSDRNLASTNRKNINIFSDMTNHTNCPIYAPHIHKNCHRYTLAPPPLGHKKRSRIDRLSLSPFSFSLFLFCSLPSSPIHHPYIFFCVSVIKKYMHAHRSNVCAMVDFIASITRAKSHESYSPVAKSKEQKEKRNWCAEQRLRKKGHKQNNRI